MYQVVCSLCGKFFTAYILGCVYSYTSELFPTNSRSAAVGLCSTFGRIGGILAPIVANLVIEKSGDGLIPSIESVELTIDSCREGKLVRRCHSWCSPLSISSSDLCVWCCQRQITCRFHPIYEKQWLCAGKLKQSFIPLIDLTLCSTNDQLIHIARFISSLIARSLAHLFDFASFPLRFVDSVNHSSTCFVS